MSSTIEKYSSLLKTISKIYLIDQEICFTLYFFLLLFLPLFLYSSSFSWKQVRQYCFHVDFCHTVISVESSDHKSHQFSQVCTCMPLHFSFFILWEITSTEDIFPSRQIRDIDLVVLYKERGIYSTYSKGFKKKKKAGRGIAYFGNK